VKRIFVLLTDGFQFFLVCVLIMTFVDCIPNFIEKLQYAAELLTLQVFALRWEAHLKPY